jgi:PhnB protein
MATTQISPYLNFQGDCEAAFKFYEQALGARVGAIFRYTGSPLAGTVPADWSDKVMHGSVTIGDEVLMGADVGPDQYEAPKGFALALSLASAADADRVFKDISDGGRVLMALEKTFWAERFGMVVDRFGIPWMVSCGGGQQP